MRKLKLFGFLFLMFSVVSAFLILPDIFGSAWLAERLVGEELSVLFKGQAVEIPGVGDRINLYSALVSAAGLGLVSLSLWLAISSADSQNRTEQNRWIRHMLEEWHSPEMNAARHQWFNDGRDKIIEENVASSLIRDVFVIVNFFEKYGRLCEAGALDVSLAKNVFGDYAAWYRDNFFVPVLDSSIYDSRMRAIDRKKYIDDFLLKVATVDVKPPPGEPPPKKVEDVAKTFDKSSPTEPAVVEVEKNMP